MSDLVQKLGGIDVEDDLFSDNLAIALTSYFESHINRPIDDETDENGWSVWAVAKAKRALELIAARLEETK